MNTVTVYFSDKSYLTLTEDDSLIPVCENTVSDKKAACLGIPVELYSHIHYGLIPSIMDVLCFCKFFYVSGNSDVVYCTGSIIKIENA